MLYPPGSSATERRRLREALHDEHLEIATRVRVLNRNEKIVTTLPRDSILTGAVHGNVQADPTRSLNLTLIQPGRAGRWIPTNPSDAAIFADNFLQVHYGVNVSDDGWQWIPVFRGRPTEILDTGETLEITAGGKESLHLDPYLMWNTMKIPADVTRDKAIRRILAAGGERSFDLPEITSRLGKRLQIGPHGERWRKASQVANSIDRQLFFDGLGRAKVRRFPRNRAWTLQPGEDSMLLSDPQITYTVGAAGDVANTVQVLGPNPKGPVKRIQSVARAPAWHPLSAASLSRHGHPGRMVEIVDLARGFPTRLELEREKGEWRIPEGWPRKHRKRWQRRRHGVLVRTQRQADDLAEETLEDMLDTAVDVRAECVPVPMVEENDIWGVALDDGINLSFRMKEWTLPLVSGESMSVGYRKRVTWKKRRR